MTDRPGLTKTRRRHGLHQLEARVETLERLLEEERQGRYDLTQRVLALQCTVDDAALTAAMKVHARGQ